MTAQPIERYDDLVAALRERRLALGMTNTDLELTAGLQSGYVAKIENYRSEAPKAYTRNIGPVVLDRLLEHLGMVLLAVEKKSMLAAASTAILLQNQASIGGKKRAESLSKKRRIAIARDAAKKRWVKKRRHAG